MPVLSCKFVCTYQSISHVQYTPCFETKGKGGTILVFTGCLGYMKGDFQTLFWDTFGWNRWLIIRYYGGNLLYLHIKVNMDKKTCRVMKVQRRPGNRESTDAPTLVAKQMMYVCKTIHY